MSAIIAFSSLLGAQPTLTASEPSISTTFSKYGIVALPGSESRLRDLLDDHTVTQVRPLIPYLLLITNNSSETIAGITVRYVRKRSPDGKIVVGTTRLATGSNWSGSDLLRPGSTLIFSPTSQLTNLLAQVRATRQAGAALSSLAQNSAASVADSRRFIGPVQVILDSVTFRNGTYCGPDTLGLLREIQEKKTAEDDIARLFATASTDQQLRGSLEQATATHSKAVDGYSIDHYTIKKRLFASVAIKLLDTKGRQETQSWISAITSETPKELRRLED